MPQETKTIYTFADGCADLAAGLACGLACLYSGQAIGDIGFKGLMAMIEEAEKHCESSNNTEDASAPLLGTASSPGSNRPSPLSIWAASYTHLLLSLVYAEALGLYGLIIGLAITCYY